jgi:hypothetical protein
MPLSLWSCLKKTTMRKKRNNKIMMPETGKRSFFQPKLMVDKSDNHLEKEADNNAQNVMRSETLSIQSKLQPGDLSGRKEIDDNSSTGKYISSLNNSGQPLPENIRNFYEPKFGHDLSNVKIHTDGNAENSAQSINALAYTTGNDIVFGKSQYAPETATGKKLLGHELTHVVQQNATPQNPISIQREEASPATDLPGDEPQLPRNEFVTPDSLGITNNKDSKISLDIHVDYLPSHTRLHVFIATQPGGDYRQGAPLKIIGVPGKGVDDNVTLSPVPSHFYIRFEARSETTGINVPGIRGTCVMSLD